MKKVIIDCDTGIDDALAIIYAVKSKKIDILGITSVCGNVPTKNSYENSLKVLRLLDRLDIPVFFGETAPIKKALVTAQDTHGEDGLGETYFPKVEMKPAGDATDFIVKTLKNEKDVSVLALGPLTNIAVALRKDEEAFENLDRFVNMGGNFKSFGNTSPVAEFNYWVDPDAADYVYKHLKVPVEMVGLDVTRKIVLTPEILKIIVRYGGELGAFIEKITKFYFDFHKRQENLDGCVINDPLAVGQFLDNSYCSGFYSYTEVVTDGIARGQSIVDEMNFYKREKNSIIYTEVDERKFMKDFLETILEMDLSDIGGDLL